MSAEEDLLTIAREIASADRPEGYVVPTDVLNALARLTVSIATKPANLDLPAEPRPGWLYGSDMEEWSGVFEARELAIEAAYEEYYGIAGCPIEEQTTDDHFFVAYGEPLTYKRLNGYLNAGWILEEVSAGLHDDEASDPEGDSQIEFVDLKAAQAGLEAWARQHIKLPGWCEIATGRIDKILRTSLGKPDAKD